MTLYLFRRTYRCRQCHSLAYPTQNMSGRQRSKHMAKKLWTRIAVQHPETGELLKRPRLRWRTVKRIADRAEEYERKYGDGPEKHDERPLR
jgi:hypothetical protein